MAKSFPFHLDDWWREWNAMQSRGRIATVTPGAKQPAPAEHHAVSDEEAHVRLLFEEDDALQRRVADTITQLFFGAQGVYGTKPAQNCDALFKQLVKNASPTYESRKLIGAALRDEVRAVVQELARQEIKEAVAKQVAEMEKYSRRISAAPKGPRR